jgi:hypothetical protein
VAVVIVALVAALYFLGVNTGDDDGGDRAGTSTPRTTTKSSSSRKGGAAAGAPTKKKKSKPKYARLSLVATGQVYVCLKAAGDRTPINGIVLTGGAHQGPYRSSRFRLQLGTSEARLVVNGKSRSVPSVSNGIGYEITPTKVRRLPRSRWPSCARS